MRRRAGSGGPLLPAVRLVTVADLRVIYLGGLGRSGSTLLERLLAEVPGACACGEIAHLWQRGIVANGHESMDTDTTDKMDSETYILQHGHFQIEVMANLDKVPPTGALIVVTWPKVENGLGFPARAFAILP